MKFLERQLEDPVRLKQLRRWSYAALAVIVASEVAVPALFHAEPAHFWFEDLPAFGSIYGLVSCAAIIVFSKLLGKLWLARPENYYDR
jgi:hypothetical protein